MQIIIVIHTDLINAKLLLRNNQYFYEAKQALSQLKRRIIYNYYKQFLAAVRDRVSSDKNRYQPVIYHLDSCVS